MSVRRWDMEDAVVALCRAREASGLSLDRVAQICGLSRGRLANYESFQRTPDLDTLRRWARAVGQEVVFEVRPLLPPGRYAPRRTASDSERVELHRSVSEFSLSVRTRNCFTNAGITHIWQVAAMTEAEALRMRNFGRTSLDEVRSLLLDLGLSFGMDLAEQAAK